MIAKEEGSIPFSICVQMIQYYIGNGTMLVIKGKIKIQFYLVSCSLQQQLSHTACQCTSLHC